MNVRSDCTHDEGNDVSFEESVDELRVVGDAFFVQGVVAATEGDDP